MRRRPDAALEVALEQRQRIMDDAQAALSLRERAVAEQALAVSEARARVTAVLQQMDAAQRPTVGAALPIGVLSDLETLLDWCEVQVIVQEQRLAEVQADADVARGELATAHQNVRALELVLDARRAGRAERARREELRLADETAARVHSQNALAAR
jgi:Flagellar FliJ protein